ncbi:MAG: 50S ribosomal protein L22 [Methanopyri archaeon]|nr:50S ribosomal protein L22 [Methanopyri archaeon]
MTRTKKWHYSIPPEELDEDRTAKAFIRELRISPKHAREICRAIRGMPLDRAKEFLRRVIRQEEAVPFRKHKKKVPHRRQIRPGWDAGRFPRKAAEHILRVLEHAEANAEQKGLDTDRLYIKHIAAHKGRVIRGWIPRAFGRATPFNTPTTHIEVILEER